MSNKTEKLLRVQSSNFHKEFIKLNYQNGLYQGQHNGYINEGIGCFCSDDGLFYIGQWVRDSLHGLGVLFFPRSGFYYGYFEKNLMNGIGILKYGNNNLIVGNWKDSLFHGVTFKYNNSRNFWSIEEYENGVFKTKVCEKEFQKDTKNSGFCLDDKFHGLGVVYKKNKAIYMGEFQDGKYEGLGRRCFENDDIADGLWKQGFMYDIGVYYKNMSNSYLFGCFYEDQPSALYHKGEDFPFILINKIRNKLHMQSPYYIEKEFSFSKVKFQEDVFVKLFFNFHKNHQEPLHVFNPKKSFAYFNDNNSKYINKEKKIEPKPMEKKEKNKKNIIKVIREINHLSPDNDKKVKLREKKRVFPPKIFKKIENLNVKSIQVDMREDNALFQPIKIVDETLTKKSKNTFIFGDSSLNRLKLLGLEKILEEIHEVEEKKRKEIFEIFNNE